MNFNRRVLFKGAALAGLAVTGLAQPARAEDESWVQRWSADPAQDGTDKFFGLEQATNHPDVQHIYVSDGAYQFDIHCPPEFSDVDAGHDDRQRTEYRGMRVDGKELKILQDETWKINYAMYIPATLHATTGFTHIMQVKAYQVGSPLITISLHVHSGVPSIELRTTDSAGNWIHHNPVPLDGLQEKWLVNEVQFTASHDPGGSLHWTLNDGTQNVVDYQADNLDLWRDLNWLRFKSGVYRSLGSAGLETTYLRLKDMTCSQLVG